MGTLKRDLIAGETVKYDGREHWIVLVGPVAGALVFVAAGGALFYAGTIQQASITEWLNIAGIAIFCIAALFLIRGIWRRRSIEYVVTNRRVIIKRGVLERRTEEIPLSKIESIIVDQGLMGRMLGYGTVTIRGTGGTFEPFLRVERPLELRRQVQEQIASAAKPYSP